MAALTLSRKLDLDCSSSPPSSGADPSPGRVRYLTTGDPAQLASLLPRLAADPAPVEPIYWRDSQLHPKILP